MHSVVWMKFPKHYYSWQYLLQGTRNKQEYKKKVKMSTSFPASFSKLVQHAARLLVNCAQDEGIQDGWRCTEESPLSLTTIAMRRRLSSSSRLKAPLGASLASAVTTSSSEDPLLHLRNYTTGDSAADK